MKKQFKRICCIILALALAMSTMIMSASAEEETVAESTKVITGVEYGENYVATAATENDWINSPSASSNIVKVTFSDGTSVEAAEGNVLTLVLGGVQFDILDMYEDEIDFAALEESLAAEGLEIVWAETTDDYSFSEPGKFMNMGGNTAQYTYRAALTVADGAIVDADSIPALYSSVTAVDGAHIEGGFMESWGAFFNGIIVKGSTEYTIKDTEFLFVGDGANDFQGEAAVILAEDTSVVTLDGVVINTAGVIRTGAAVKENGKLYIKNSVIFTEESLDTDDEYNALVVPMMKRTPFALGLEGVVRATNVLGSGEGIYSDSIIVSTGWGALSTDSGNVGVQALTVDNVLAGIGWLEIADAGTEYTATKTIDGVEYGFIVEGSGYVAYADAGVIDVFNNVEFYSPQYIQIMASSTSSAYYTNSDLNSGTIAVMTQQNKGGVISIKDSTVNVADTVVQIKSGAANEGYTNVVLDNADINFTANNPWGGVLVEVVESDDAGNPGNISFTINDKGDELGVNDAKGIQGTSTAVLKNGTYEGDIYNNIYNYYSMLEVTLEKADLVGTVSASYGYHVDDNGERLANGTVLTASNAGDYREVTSGDFMKIGAQVNVVSPVDVNPIDLTIDANSSWTIGKENYLNVLSVADAGSLKGEGVVYASEYYVNGEKQADGEYVYGGVKVVVEYNDELPAWLEKAADSGVLGSGQDYTGDANKYEITVVDEDGNPASRYLNLDNASKANADGTVSFNVIAAEGYAVEVVEIKHDDNITMLDASTAEGFTYGFTISKAEGGAEGGQGEMGPMPGDPMMGGSSASNVTVVVRVTDLSATPDAPAGEEDESPKTADMSYVTIMTCIAIVSAGCYIVLNKKRT